jgi:hypothetical protein
MMLQLPGGLAVSSVSLAAFAQSRMDFSFCTFGGGGSWAASTGTAIPRAQAVITKYLALLAIFLSSQVS